MKKIFVFAFAMVFCGFAANAQNSLPKKVIKKNVKVENANNTVGQQNASEVAPAIITNKSAGPLVIGQKMVETAPEGAFFDMVKYVKDEYSSSYTLYKNNKKIGSVSVNSRGEIENITVDGKCNVQTENGITIGMPYGEAVGKPGVKALAERMDDGFMLTIEYNGLRIFSNYDSDDCLSQQGKARLKKAPQNRDGYLELKSTDFKKDAVVDSFFANGMD